MELRLSIFGIAIALTSVNAIAQTASAKDLSRHWDTNPKWCEIRHSAVKENSKGLVYYVHEQCNPGDAIRFNWDISPTDLLYFCEVSSMIFVPSNYKHGNPEKMGKGVLCTYQPKKLRHSLY
jgi:hypothetical protein